ncbi:hypothetical protein CC80DRAFT_401863 [Byssothecium circinans]|uniref:Integral membrane protein n=1 Tax=Byssothecium circinans TaxID=147558 RepID=A0A6A5UAU4_9PLEO|nr:hypothetical protein CC80DRAFT_401863 [Byssothecium circinans]
MFTNDDVAVRVLRLLPVLTSGATLMYAVDEHIFLGTWVHPSLRDRANVHLPVWFQHWLRRGRWPIMLGYPANFSLAILNLIVARDECATMWYALGFLFTLGHVAIYARTAVKLLADIQADIPKGNSTHSMGVWLRMNWLRALTTDLPAWICFIVAALKTL